jgi:hypothetical protein
VTRGTARCSPACVRTLSVGIVFDLDVCQLINMCANLSSYLHERGDASAKRT